MMEELCYSALDIAAIIAGMGLGCQAQAEFLNRIWENERPFLQKDYRDNKRKLILDVSSMAAESRMSGSSAGRLWGNMDIRDCLLHWWNISINAPTSTTCNLM